MPESERLAIVGNLFAHFGLSTVARQSASSLNSEQRHLLAIASALSFSPAAIVADAPTKGLGAGGRRPRGGIRRGTCRRGRVL